MIQKLALILTLTFYCNFSLSDELIGLWQHESQPVVVEIQQQEGADNALIGIIKSHDERPQATGRTFFKDLAPGKKENTWRGQVYAQRMQEFRDVSIQMLSPDEFKMTIKAGFVSRSFLWNRVAEAGTTAE